MRKRIINFLALFCFFLPVFGQEVAESLQLGYCCGENGNMGDITSSNAKTISAGIYIPSGMTESLVGNHVESIRVYLPSKLNITSLTVWLRSSLDGENMAEGTVKAKQLEKGWNEIALETPYDLKDNTPFYLGYTFEQKSRAYGICCTGFYVDGGLYYKFDDGEWETENKYGNLCVEGVVKGDKLPVYDLELNFVSVPPVYYTGDKLSVKMRVINHAAATIKGFTLTYSLPEVFTETYHVDCNLTPGRSEDLNLELPAVNLPEGKDATVTFTISALDEGEDEAPGNNTKEVTISSANNKFKKVVLVEEFTTEMCGNCPTAAPKVYGAIDRFNEEHPGAVAMICHHAGYYTDFLTSKFDESYVMLYGGGSYAPAAMVDRYDSKYSSPVFGIASEEAVYDKIVEAYNRPVNYSLEPKAIFDSATSTLNVEVTGSRLVDSDVTPTRISVVVVENNIPSQRQSGADSSYIHQHAMRTANSTWGDVIDWSGYDFSYKCSLPIEDEWKKDELDLIVYINQYNADDESECYIENTRKIKFSDILESVKTIEGEGSKPVVNVVDGTVTTNEPYTVANIWTLDGQNVANGNLANGIYLVKVVGNGMTHVEKLHIR